jgi:hypothetical protein
MGLRFRVSLRPCPCRRQTANQGQASFLDSASDPLTYDEYVALLEDEESLADVTTRNAVVVLEISVGDQVKAVERLRLPEGSELSRIHDVVIPLDYNGDGYTDFAIFSKNGNNTRIELLINQGDTLVSEFVVDSELSFDDAQFILIADYSGNGFPDLFLPEDRYERYRAYH